MPLKRLRFLFIGLMRNLQPILDTLKGIRYSQSDIEDHMRKINRPIITIINN